MATIGGLPKTWTFSRCAQVVQPALDGARVGLAELLLGHAAVHLEGADGGHDHDGGGVEAGGAALEVEELLAAEVEGEPGLGDGVVGVGQGHPGGEHRVAAVGDVGERPAVDEGRRPLERLDQVGQEGLLEQDRHRAHGPEVGGGTGVPSWRSRPGSGRAGRGGRRRSGQAEDGHDLAGRRDVEPGLARDPLRGPPRPMTIWRRARSFMSSARFQRRAGVEPRAFPEVEVVVDLAASRLWAAVIAWKSPVNWRLMCSTGITIERPPPVAPPFRPKTGPIDGWRRARQGRLPIRASPWARPIEIVVFPSPAGGRRDRRDQDQLARAGGPTPGRARRTLALSRP